MLKAKPAENVRELTYLVVLITDIYDNSPEVKKRRIADCKKCNNSTNNDLKQRSKSIREKLRLLKALVFP